MSDESLPQSEIILYQTEDGRTRIQCRLEGETIWLTQKQMAELFQKDVRTINEHIQNVFEERELPPDSVIRKFRITATDGKTYETQHYNLAAIIAEGEVTEAATCKDYLQVRVEGIRSEFGAQFLNRARSVIKFPRMNLPRKPDLRSLTYTAFRYILFQVRAREILSTPRSTRRKRPRTGLFFSR